MRKYTALILLFFCSLVYAQMHEWAKSFTAFPLSGNYNSATGLDLDSKDNAYMVGMFTDSFSVGTSIVVLKPSLSSSQNSNAYISKIDTNGNVKWVKTLYVYDNNNTTGTQSYLNLSNIKVISDNKIVIYGSFYTSGSSNSKSVLKLSPTDSLIANMTLNANSPLFVAIYDSLGNLLNYRKIIDHRTAISAYFGINTSGYIEIDCDNNIYLSCYTSLGKDVYAYTKDDSVQIDTTAYYNYRHFVLKYTPDFDSLIWFKEVAKADNSIFFSVIRIKTGKDNNLYMATNITHDVFSNSGGSAIIDGSLYSISDSVKNKGFIVVLSPKGDIIHKGYVNQNPDQGDFLSSIEAIDTNRMYIVGAVKDTLLRNNVQYYTSNPKPPDLSHSVGVGRDTLFSFIGKIGTQDASWIKMTDKRISTRTHPGNPYGITLGWQVVIDDSGYLYAQLPNGLNSTMNIGGLTSDSSSYIGGVFSKFDTLGNALWLTRVQ